MSENWIGFTDADVLGATSAERMTIAGIKRRDDLADICSQVIGQVRQAYQLSNRDLGPDGTVPEGFKARAVAIALWRFVSEGVPALPKMQTKERKDASEEATKYLAQISSAEVGKASSPSVGSRTRRFSQREQEGTL
jgi:hypothetical protein